MQPQRQSGRGGRGGKEDREFNQEIWIWRVTRVTKGGKRMNFRACVIIGDGKGRVGYGVAKGADVAMSVEKAVRQAKRGLSLFLFSRDGSTSD